jgi:pimeloyl-ACP methyl ester carboxylesterase
MPFVTVGKENSGSIELYYEDHGKGRPIVLIHGYPLSGRAWERQIPTLLDLGYRVITYDRRGFGNSSQPWSGYNYDTFADDLHKLVTELDLRDFLLMGHSMGGGEVARYLGKYGGKNVSKAVFLAGIPPYLRKATENPEGVDGKVFDGIKKAVLADRPAFFTKFFADFYNVDKFGGKLISEDDIRINWITSVNASPKAALDCVDTWGTDFRNDLKQIDIPTLTVQGDADRIVPFASSGKRMPALVKGNKLVVIEGAPHGLAWTHAEQVNRAVAEFLGKAAQTSKVA